MTRLKRLQVVAWVLLLAVTVSTFLLPLGTVRVSAVGEPENRAAYLEQKAVDFILKKYEDEGVFDPYTVYVLTQAEKFDPVKNWKTKDIAQYLLALVGLGLENGEEADRLAKILLERHREDSFENSVYSDFWGYLALAEAGRLDGLNDRDDVDGYIRSKQAEDGSWGESFVIDGEDMYFPDFLATTEAIRVLHRLDPEEKNIDIQTAIQKGLGYLKDFRQEDGGVYNEWDDPVVDTAALVITLLELGKNPTGPDWSGGADGANPVTYLLTKAYNHEDGSFSALYDELLTVTYALHAYIMLQGAEVDAGNDKGALPPSNAEEDFDEAENPGQEERLLVLDKVVEEGEAVSFAPEQPVIDSRDNPGGEERDLDALLGTEQSDGEDSGLILVDGDQVEEEPVEGMYQVNGDDSPSAAVSEEENNEEDEGPVPDNPLDVLELMLEDPEEGSGLEQELMEESDGDDLVVLLEEDGGGLDAEELARRAVEFICGEYDENVGLEPYPLYVLALAGEEVDVSWLGRKWAILSLENQVMGLAAELDEEKGTKVIAQYLLALVGLGEDGEEADRLSGILMGRHGENSFDNSVYSDFWGYLALAEAGRLDDLDRDIAVGYILRKQAQDGSWGESFVNDDGEAVYFPDFLATTEAIRVLYCLDPEGTDVEIIDAIERGLGYLKGFCQEDGGVYNEWDDPVTDTAALVMTLLVLDKDPTGPEWSRSGDGVNPITYLLTRAYNEEDENFGGLYDELLTATYALQAYIMLQGAGLGDGEGNGPPSGGGNGGTQPPGEKDQEGKFQVEVKVVGKGGTALFGPRTVTITDDNPWGRTALGALHATGLSYEDDGGFVWKIEGEANAGMSGWMYQVNGVIAAVIASAKEIKAGDRVLWWYSTDPNDIPSWVDDPELLPESPGEETGLDKELTEALAEAEAGEEIIVTLIEDEEVLEAVFSATKVQDLVEKRVTLVIKGPDPADPVLIIPAAALATEAVQEALKEEEVPAIRLGYRRLLVAEEDELQDVITGLGQKNLFLVGGALYQLEITLGEEPLPGFAVGITARFPLAVEDKSDINFIGLYRLSGAGAGVKEEFIPGIPVYEEGEDRWYIEARLDRFSLFALLRYKASFADLKGHWAREAVELMAARRVIAGMSAEEFAPDLPVTRAQLAAMLVKALDLEAVTPAEPTFRDVEAGTWYYTPVETAYQAGLAAGRGNGEFDPAAPVTRQEMAVLVARTLEIYSGQDTDTYQVEANLRRFADMDAIAPWAQGAAARVVQEGIMTGMPGRLFAPRGTATRAQAAVVLKNIFQTMEKII